MIDNVQSVSSLSLTRGIGSIATEKTSGLSSAEGTTPGASAAPSFASVMTNMATEMTNSLKHAESASMEGIKGNATTREVVDAVLQAEQSLQTAIALRDKVVSAFLDVTKMQM